MRRYLLFFSSLFIFIAGQFVMALPSQLNRCELTFIADRSSHLLSTGISDADIASTEQNLRSVNILSKSNKNNRAMNTQRGIVQYRKIFGEEFFRLLYGLKPHQRYLDSGGGEGISVLEYLHSGGQAQVVLLSLETTAKSEERLNVIQGRMLETIPTHELGYFDLITDLFGPLSYSPRPDIILSKYLEMLADNGTLFITIRETTEKLNTVILPNGKILKLTDWIASIDGIEVQKMMSKPEEPQTLKIKKVKPNAKAPGLTLISEKWDLPPTRQFVQSYENFELQSAERSQALRHRLEEMDYTQRISYQRSLSQSAFSFDINLSPLEPILRSQPNIHWYELSYGEALLRHIDKEVKSKNEKLQEKGGLFERLSNRAKKIPIPLPRHVKSPDSIQKSDQMTVITDISGPFLLFGRPDEVLRSYLSNLKNGDVIVLGFSESHRDLELHISSIIIHAGNGNLERMSIKEWLYKIPGLRVLDPDNSNRVILEVVDHSKIKIPNLIPMGWGILDRKIGPGVFLQD